MPFIAERIYVTVAGEKESVHLESWPAVGVIDGDVIVRMKTAREVVSSALMKRTESKIAVRQPLATLTVTEDLPESYLSIIQEEVNVKAITVGLELSLDTTITEDLRIEGDIRNLMRAVQDKRKEMNLSPKDVISLTLQTPYDLGDVSELSRVCNIQTISRSDIAQETEVALSQGSASFTITL
jgi:isoleucyl-tRNA synthetase